MAYLVNVFLGGEEMERKRSELAKLIQSPYESTGTYIIRFREKADEAYPHAENAPRNEVHEQILRDTFLRGLRNDQITKYVITRPHMDTLQQAFTAVTTKSDANERYDRLISVQNTPRTETRVDTPMEIDAVASQSREREHNDTLKQILDAIARINVSQDKSAKQNKQNGGGHVSRHPGSDRKYNDRKYTDPNPRERRPKTCFRCGLLGHIRKECRTNLDPRPAHDKHRNYFHAAKSSHYDEH
jgi:hypothetical protein